MTLPVRQHAIGPIDTYNGATAVTCSFDETPPANPTGYTFGTPTFNPTNKKVTITKGLAANAVVATVTNTLSVISDFKITKSVSNPNGATLPAAFTGTYTCGTGYTGNFSVAAGASQTISGIPTGNPVLKPSDCQHVSSYDCDQQQGRYI